MRDNPRVTRVSEVLDAIAFHPDISWTCDRHMGGPHPFGESPNIQVAFSWVIDDPRNQPTGRDRYTITEVITSSEIVDLRDGLLKQRLLDIHRRLWLHVSEEWSQDKPRRHLRCLS
jgi:hypothetical protein